MDKIGSFKYSAGDITDTLLGMADSRQVKIMQRFFKTGPGEYSEGDKFIGLKNPQVRLVVKEAWKNTPLEEAVKLVKSPLHEVRLCGLLIMVEKYLQGLGAASSHNQRRKPIISNIQGKPSCDEIYETYLRLHPYINNWDLVDLSAIKIVGNHEAHGLGAGSSPSLSTSLDEWIKPGHTLWQQRIAMVSTWMLIRKGMPEVTFQRATYLLDSPHDLLHKAAGWMLREAWKHGYKDELRSFLQTHIKRMSSIMLSYACEQMPVEERHHWQQLRKS